MKIAFLGKGGSGKSSVSSQMAFFLRQKESTVLAIDADHNMDLSYNLAQREVPPMQYLSESLKDFQNAVHLSNEEKYSEVFLRDTEVRFTLSPLSPEIENYSVLLENNIRLMTAGPQTDTVLYGKACSHSLTTPLKLLLPLLTTQGNEVVIIDEKAGADGVSTGIISGADVGVIVCEPTLHSTKTALQISELMEFYKTPSIIVGNKIQTSEDKDFITKQLQQEPAVFLMESGSIKRNPSEPVTEWHDELEVIFNTAKDMNRNDSLQRTIEKFKRNDTFNASQQ